MNRNETMQGRRRKKAILFGGTDGHGITMTAISERALLGQGYAVETICRYYPDIKRNHDTGEYPDDCGTGAPELFWGRTFPTWDFSSLLPGDVIMVVDIPLPVQQRITEYSAADAGICAIRTLCTEGKRVVLIDHHNRALTDYGKAVEAGAEMLFSAGPVRYAHYGIPDDYSLFWGSIGAVSDRDRTMLPVEESEKEPFGNLEQFSVWLDQAKINLNKTGPDIIDPLTRIRNDNRAFVPAKPVQAPVSTRLGGGRIAYIKKLGPKGFKELDYACRLEKNPYGIGIGINQEGKYYVLVINYWDPEEGTKVGVSPPVALKLHRWRKVAGHDTAVTIPAETQEHAEKIVESVEKILTSNTMSPEGSFRKDPDVIDYLVRAIESSHQQIPHWLTTHGWNHIETVFANVHLLGTLLNCSAHDQEILNWSALFHDLGNGAEQCKNFCDLNKDFLKSGDIIRDHHHELTVQILDCWRTKGFCKGSSCDRDLISDSDFEIIKEVCRRHRRRSAKPPHDDRHVEELCAIFRVADALDKTRSRARKNDQGTPYSKLKEELIRAGKLDSIEHWEGQQSIESIRLHIRRTGTRNHITFEFLITDYEKARSMIRDFEEELGSLTNGTADWEINVIRVPRFS